MQRLKLLLKQIKIFNKEVTTVCSPVDPKPRGARKGCGRSEMEINENLILEAVVELTGLTDLSKVDSIRISVDRKGGFFTVSSYCIHETNPGNYECAERKMIIDRPGKEINI